MNPPPVEHELFLADYIAMFVVVAPFAAIFFVFAFYVIEIIYLRNYKKPLLVFANIQFKNLTENQKHILTSNFNFYNNLKPKYKRYFEHRISKFISNYEFLGRDISVTEEMKITISATYVMLTFGMPVLDAINKHAKKTIDVHLMIVDPDRYISTFKKLGADVLTVHFEACTHLHRTLQAIKAEGMKAGVALNPHTNVDLLEDVIQDIDLVCVMSVNPGFGGQSFIENTYDKVKKLKALIERKNASTLIEIDGGVTNKNAKQLADAGADVLVAGSYVFGAENPLATIADLKVITK
ncbi:ribulose-phosphate 3-epimerase [Flavobacterium sp.]|uniref:ribulose-phosphate 3-epimerase n=1 Tax=Flavobacterium sp. TaxID=239 RepID=UPI00404B3833